MNLKKSFLLLILVVIFALALSSLLVSCEKKVNIEYIEIYNPPKLNYIQGEELDLSNAQIRVVYKNKTERLIDVEPMMISGYDPNFLGKQYINVYFEDRMTTFEVTVIKQSVQTMVVEISSNDSTLIEDQPLRLEDVFVVLTLIDGSKEFIPVTEDMCEGYDYTKIGKQTVTVKFNYAGEEKQVQFVVSVLEKELIGIEVEKKPIKNIYYVGEENLSLVGGELFLKYNSGYTEIIDMMENINKLSYNWDNITVNDRSMVELFYEGFSTFFDVQVKVRDVLSFRFIQPPKEQMQYIPLDLTESIIEITYNNNEVEELLLPNEKIAILGYDSRFAGEQTAQIVFSYSGVELKTKKVHTFFVVEKQEESIEICRPSDQILYQDTEIDTDEWTYRIIYNNGEKSEEYPFELSMVLWAAEEPVLSYFEPGEYTWTIKRSEEIEIAYTFEIEPLTVNSIKLVNSKGDLVSNVNVFLMDEFDENSIFMDIYMQVTYSNGKERVPNPGMPGIPLLAGMISYDKEKEGSINAEINYFDDAYENIDFVTSLNINVVRRVQSVDIVALSGQDYIVSPSGERYVQYILNEIFEPSGFVFEVFYEHFSESVTFSPNDDENSEFLKRGWSFSCSWWDDENRFIEVNSLDENGNEIYIVVELNNPGLEESFPINVRVTNDFVEFSENPFYMKIGDEYQAVENLGEVLPGKPVNLGNYYVEIIYQTGVSRKEITSEMILDLDINNTILDRRDILVYYPRVPISQEEEETYPWRATYVSVVETSIVRIEVVREPYKKIYYQVPGGTEVLDEDGIIIHIVYDNGTSKNINIKQAILDNKLFFAGFSSGIIGVQEIIVTYYDTDFQGQGYDATFEVEVLEKELMSIAWKGDSNYVEWLGDEVVYPSITKREGENIDLGNLYTTKKLIEGEEYIESFLSLFLVLKFTDGSEEDVIYEDFYNQLQVEDYNRDSSINQHIKLVYKHHAGKDIFLPVFVYMEKSVLLEIFIPDDSPVFSAVQGAEINLAGIKLGLKFETSGQKEDDRFVPMTNLYINKSEFNPNGYDKTNELVGDRIVKIKYVFDNIEKEIEVTVNVTKKVLEKIELSDIPKIYYLEHEEFDKNEGSITAFFNNGETIELNLRDAILDNNTAMFSISTENFNNSEFSGYDKVQRIFVYYSSDASMTDRQTLGYNIVMRDRKNVEVRFRSQNVYTYIYGQYGQDGQVEKPVVVDLWGYNDYEDETRNSIYPPAKYKIEYIEQNIWISKLMNPNVDYTILPKNVGVYYIVISFEGDELHNEFEHSGMTLTINKKDLYITFYPGQSKIYGEDIPDILLVFKARKEGVIPQDPYSLFAYDDDFWSPNFNPSSNTFPSICYIANADGEKYIDSGGSIELNIFDYKILKTGGEVLAKDSSAGSYAIAFDIGNRINSSNYNIVFENATFTVQKREVTVTPISLSYIFGDSMPVIDYTTSKVTGIEESGMYESDSLSGQLNRENPNIRDVGDYLIVKGDLGRENPNYEVRFFNDSIFVSILPRKIYARADSFVVTYGEYFEEFSVQYFKDYLCTLKEGVFAQGDLPDDLFDLDFIHEISWISPIGSYDITPLISYKEGGENNGEGEVKKNYEVTCISGLVFIEKRAVLVSATSVTKIFGDEDPELLYTTSPVEGLSASGLADLRDEYGNPIFEGGLPKKESLLGELVRDLGENIGVYRIRAGSLENHPSNSNYQITFISGNLTITPKSLYVTINPSALSKVYDGKKPDIPSTELVVFEIGNDGTPGEVYINSQAILEHIQVSCQNAFKDVGEYSVQLTQNNPNYNMTLFNPNTGGNSYVFTINQRSIRINYIEIPHNMEYKAAPYIIAASVHPDDIRPQYNEDGTIKTDANNQIIFDNVAVFLTLSSATNKGDYNTKVDSISDSNYYLASENNQTVSFTILPRTLYISINVNSQDGLTFEKEYDGVPAGFYPSDYLLSNEIPNYIPPVFELGVMVAYGEQPSDVKFDANGDVVSYNVEIKQNSDDPNFIYQLAKPYKYKIIQKGVKINIIENYLTKQYDGNPPTIASGAYTFSGSENVDKNDIVFTYSRVTASDGRSNKDSGQYAISVNCVDKNYLVTLAQNYVYTITEKNVKITLRSSAREREYNGSSINLNKEDVEVSGGTASVPKVRNFNNVNLYNDFVASLELLTTSANQLRMAVEKIVIDGDTIPFAQTNIVSAQSALASFSLVFAEKQDILESLSKTTILNSRIGLENTLATTLNALNSGNLDLAFGNLQLAKGYMSGVFEKITYENTYLAFSYDVDDEGSTVDAGTYMYTYESKDYNVFFELHYSEGDRYIEILPKVVIVNVQERRIRYGSAKLDAEENKYIDYSHYFSDAYTIIDPNTGMVIDSIDVEGYPRPNEDLERLATIGRYQVFIKNDSTNEEYMQETTGNYILTCPSYSYLFIDKALLYLRLIDHGYESTYFIYGDNIQSFDVQGYDYIDPNSSTIYNDEALWPAAGVTGNETEEERKELMKEFYGGLIVEEHPDIYAEINDYAVEYVCYIDPSNTLLGQIFNKVVNIGIYELNASGFSSVSGCYEIHVLPGSVKVSRRALEPSFLYGEAYLTKTYGNTYIDLEFSGILPQDLNDFPSLPVYTLDSDGALYDIDILAGSNDFINILLNGDDPSFMGNLFALDPTTQVGGAALYVYLDANVYNMEGAQYVLDNYYFDFGPDGQIGYELRILKRRATFQVVTTSGSPFLTTVYGSSDNVASIDYRIKYENLASHETAEDLGINRGGDYEPFIDFKKNAGQHKLDWENVYFETQFTNYEFELIESTLLVEKKAISVFMKSPLLNEDGQLPVLYERYLNTSTGMYNYDYLLERIGGLYDESNLSLIFPDIVMKGYQISPYIAKIDAHLNLGDEQPIIHGGYVVYGQYGINDFYVINIEDAENRYNISQENRLQGFAYEDDFYSVFLTGYPFAVVDFDASSPQDVYSFLPLDALTLPNHSISMSFPNSSTMVGTYEVTGLSFKGGVQNYDITYEKMDYKLITQAMKMRPSNDMILLDSNRGSDFSDLIAIELLRVDGITGIVKGIGETITYAESPFLEKTLNSQDEENFVDNNVNYFFEFEYLEKYQLFQALSEADYTFTFAEIEVLLVDIRGTPVSGQSNILEVTNADITAKVAIRFYDEFTTPGYATFFVAANEEYTYCIDKFAEGNYRSGDSHITPKQYQYDRLDLSMRLVPDITVSSNVYSASILINGSYTEGKYMTLEFRKGDVGKAFIARYASGYLVEEFELALRNITPFDGFTHDITIVFDKRVGSITVTYDYVTSVIAYIEYIGFTTLPAPQSLQTIYEASEMGFSLVKCEAYLRYFIYSNQGYYDNFATKVQRVNVNTEGQWKGENDLHLLLVNNEQTEAQLDVRTVFSPYMPRISGMRFDYFVNGFLVLSIDYEDTFSLILNPEGFLITLYPGLNQIEVYVYFDDGLAGEVLVCTEKASCMVDYQPYSFKLLRAGESTPVSPDGGRMKFYNPREENPDLFDPDSPDRSRYLLTQYHSPSEQDSSGAPLIRSIEYTMSFGEAKGIGAGGGMGEEYTIGETQMSFNFFMYGAIYSVGDSPGTARGISFVLVKDRTGQAQGSYSYSARLVFANRLPGSDHSPKQFPVPLNEINYSFDDQARYTFGFYFDRDSYSDLGYTRRVGDSGFFMRILRNGVPLFAEYIDMEYILENVDFTLVGDDEPGSISFGSNPDYDILSPIWLTTQAGQDNGCSISASRNFDNILYDVSINRNAVGYSDYVLDNAYLQRDSMNGNIVSAGPGGASISIADNHENQAYMRFENTSLKYEVLNAGNDASFEWHFAANEEIDIGLGNDNAYNKGMKLVYDADAESLKYYFYYDGWDYLAQNLIAGSLMDNSVKHTIRVEFDRMRYSTTEDTDFNVVRGGLDLTDSRNSGLSIHYGKALIYIDDLPAQEVLFPYYNSHEAWFRKDGGIDFGNKYQGPIVGPDGENEYANYPQFLNCYNFNEFIFKDASIILYDLSAHIGRVSAEYRELVDPSSPQI